MRSRRPQAPFVTVLQGRVFLGAPWMPHWLAFDVQAARRVAAELLEAADEAEGTEAAEAS